MKYLRLHERNPRLRPTTQLILAVLRYVHALDIELILKKVTLKMSHVQFNFIANAFLVVNVTLIFTRL